MHTLLQNFMYTNKCRYNVHDYKNFMWFFQCLSKIKNCSNVLISLNGTVLTIESSKNVIKIGGGGNLREFKHQGQMRPRYFILFYFQGFQIQSHHMKLSTSKLLNSSMPSWQLALEKATKNLCSFLRKIWLRHNIKNSIRYSAHHGSLVLQTNTWEASSSTNIRTTLSVVDTQCLISCLTETGSFPNWLGVT